jgi:hypothetical protein
MFPSLVFDVPFLHVVTVPSHTSECLAFLHVVPVPSCVFCFFPYAEYDNKSFSYQENSSDKFPSEEGKATVFRDNRKALSFINFENVEFQNNFKNLIWFIKF